MKEYKNIRIVRRGITDIAADAVVNAANEDLWAGGGVCGAIFQAAGMKQLAEACNAIGHCDTGEAVITPAFNMNAKYIIHAVGPRYKDGQQNEPVLLYSAYKKSLELAGNHACRSIVFPLISAGIFGYPKEDAWKEALRACMDFIDKYSGYRLTVYFAVPDEKIASLGETVMKQIIEQPEVKQTSIFSSGADIHAKRAAIFMDTMNWCEEDSELQKAIQYSVKHSHIYYDEDYPAFDEDDLRDQEVTVTKERSFEAAGRLAKQYPGKKIAVMNFANAFHPGGGVKKGASAQEECLCRTSTLYPVISDGSLKGYYDRHNNKKYSKAKASDSVIYSEDIVVVKTDTALPERMDRREFFKVDVMTVAAPDLRKKHNPYAPVFGSGTSMSNAEQFGCHVKRILHVLDVAAANHADILVLGAFGCGAFENDPRTVANAFRTALNQFPEVFDRVEFAIYCSPKDDTNYRVFKGVLG